MPSYGIHRAVGVVSAKYNRIKDFASFMDGVVEPDVISDLGGQNKVATHFGYEPKEKLRVKNDFKSKSNLYAYLTTCNPKTEQEMGYFLHLVTDHLWFYRFLYRHEMERLYTKKKLYHDYACVAFEVENVYKVSDGNPPLFWDYIDEEPILFSRLGMHKFIDYCGKLNLKQLAKQILEAKQHWVGVPMLSNCPNASDFM